MAPLFPPTRPDWTFGEACTVLADSSQHPNVRASAVSTIGFHRLPVTALVLAKHLDDPHEDVRAWTEYFLAPHVESRVRAELRGFESDMLAELATDDGNQRSIDLRFRIRAALGDESIRQDPRFDRVGRLARNLCNGSLGDKTGLVELRDECGTKSLIGYNYLAALLLAAHDDDYGVERLVSLHASLSRMNKSRLNNEAFALANLGHPIGREAVLSELNDHTFPRSFGEIDRYLTRCPLYRWSTAADVTDWLHYDEVRWSG